jgi:hypothetical protein
MSIDVEKETLIHFRDARSEFHNGRRHSLASLHRWRLHGVRGTRLETVLIGGLRYTSREAIGRFIAAQNAAQESPTAVSVTQRNTMAEAAQVELQRAGI